MLALVQATRALPSWSVNEMLLVDVEHRRTSKWFGGKEI